MRVGVYKGIFLLTGCFSPFFVFSQEMSVSNLNNEVSGVIYNKMSPSFPSDSAVWKSTSTALSEMAAGGLATASYRSIAAALPEFLPALSVIAGWFVGEHLADYALERNGYKARYQTPAMTRDGVFYRCSYYTVGGKSGFVEAADLRATLSQCAGLGLEYFQETEPDFNWTMGFCDYFTSGNIAGICHFDARLPDGTSSSSNVQASFHGVNETPAKYCDVNEVYTQGQGCINVSKLNQPELQYNKLADQLKSEGGYNKPSAPQLDADFINALWKDSSGVDDYKGVPYSEKDKITAADVEFWRQQHPDFVPTAGEYADVIPDASGAAFPVPSGTPAHSGDLPVPTPSPVPPPSPSPSPSPEPGPDPKPGPTPDIHIDVHVDFGPDPHIPSPVVPDIPTGQQIIAPLWNIFPALHDFKLVTRNAVCPAPQFHLFGKDMTMDSQCVIAEQNRDMLARISALLWLIIAAVIILTA